MEEEEILGTLDNDVINGTPNNDRITPFSGDDVIDGGAGDDTVIFFGAHADYIISQNADGSWTITDSEEAVDNQGANIIRNVETIEFTRTGSFTPAQLLALQTTDNQTLTGTDGPEDLSGSLGDDTLSAGDGADSLYGGLGNDSLNSGAGNDFVNGGVGIDTLILDGNIANFTITNNNDGSYTVTDTRTGAANQGTDTIFNVERLVFDDGVFVQDANGTFVPENNDDNDDNGDNGDSGDNGDTNINLIADIDGLTQHIQGTGATDAFVINGSSHDYGWGQTHDGEGIVVWKGNDFDILYDVEQIKFNDGVVNQLENDTFVFVTDEELGNEDCITGSNDCHNINEIADIHGVTQYIDGTEATDAFVINGSSNDYGWGETYDGEGIVVWKGDNFDILYDVEQIKFNDATVTQLADNSFVINQQTWDDHII